VPASKAQQKAVTKYVKEKYDRMMFTMPKGRKAAIQASADAVGESLNGYVTKAVDERIARQETASAPTEGETQ